MNNLVPCRRLFQDLFDYRRDTERALGRVSSGGTFDKAPPPATSDGSLPATESYINKNARTSPCRVSLPAWIPESSRFATGKKRSRSAVSARRSTATKDAGSHCEEITYGSFEPTSALPEGAAPWNAEYRNGVRELTAAARRPRRIRANTAPRSKRIAA